MMELLHKIRPKLEKYFPTCFGKDSEDYLDDVPKYPKLAPRITQLITVIETISLVVITIVLIASLSVYDIYEEWGQTDVLLTIRITWLVHFVLLSTALKHFCNNKQKKQEMLWVMIFWQMYCMWYAGSFVYNLINEPSTVKILDFTDITNGYSVTFEYSLTKVHPANAVAVMTILIVFIIIKFLSLVALLYLRTEYRLLHKKIAYYKKSIKKHAAEFKMIAEKLNQKPFIGSANVDINHLV